MLKLAQAGVWVNERGPFNHQLPMSGDAEWETEDECWDEVEDALDHHHRRPLGEVVDQEHKNRYALTVKNDMKENAGTCLPICKNHYVTTVVEDMGENVGCLLEHA